MAEPRHFLRQTPKPDVEFNGVPRTVLPFEVQPDAGRNLADPYASEEIYRQTFSGVDYKITAVIPLVNDYDLTTPDEVREFIAIEQRLTSRQRYWINQVGSFPAPIPIPGVPGPGVPMTDEQIRKEIRSLERQKQLVADSIQNLRDRQREQVHFKTFAEIQTLSVTTRRSVHPVRRMGEKFPAYYTRGPRTIAGSMIFIQLDGDVLLDLARRTDTDPYDGEPSFVVDRLPPFNILITGINERGHMVQGALFDVTIMAGGTTFSVDDMYTEQQHTYVARWMTPMASVERSRSLMERFQAMPAHGRGPVSELELLTAPQYSSGQLRKGLPPTGRNKLGPGGKILG